MRRKKRNKQKDETMSSCTGTDIELKNMQILVLKMYFKCMNKGLAIAVSHFQACKFTSICSP